MEDGGVANSMQQEQSRQPQQPNQQVRAPPVAERLNPEVVQLLNLDGLRTRAVSLFKAISRILEDFDAYARTNTTPKWQDILGQYSMVNLELFNIVEEVRKVSKAFVVYPKNVNAENATILPVMLSSKLLPEMESDDGTKREQLLYEVQSLPVPTQIEKLKARIEMIAAACENAEKVLADTHKAYGFGTRQGPAVLPTLDKGQAAKVHEQENLLRAAVNYGEGLRIPGDQRQVTPALPIHLADLLTVGDNSHTYPEATSRSIYMRNTPLSSNGMGNQASPLQSAGPQFIGRPAASPSGATSATFDNTTSPLPYANSPRSGTSMMNAPSPQQQIQQQQMQQQQIQQQQMQQQQIQQQQMQQQQIQQSQQQQRQRLMQLPPHQQQLLAHQQLRQSTIPGMGQNQLSSLHDLQGQTPQKFQPIPGQHQMQFSQAMGHQQFQARQLPTGQMQHGISQGQLNQANQLNRHLSQFSGSPNSALFNAAQGTPNSPMLPNISATMPSQTLLPRLQFGLSGTTAQRGHPTQIPGDQIFNMGAPNPGGMMPIQSQQQQLSSQGAFGNMPPNVQSRQPNMVAMQNATQNHPNFVQQRQQNQG